MDKGESIKPPIEDSDSRPISKKNTPRRSTLLLFSRCMRALKCGLLMSGSLDHHERRLAQQLNS